MKAPIYATGLKLIPIGRRGENLAQPIVFNATDWMAEFGDGGTLALLHRRANDSEAYLCVTESSNGVLTWIPTSADTAQQGYGEAELRYIVDESVVKSVIYQTQTYKALDVGEDVPEPMQEYVDAVAENAQKAVEAKDYIVGLGVEEHMENTTIHVTASDKTTWNDKIDRSQLETATNQLAGGINAVGQMAQNHINNSVVHVTAEEKERWNAGGSAVTKEAVEQAVGGEVTLKADFDENNLWMKRYVDNADATNYQQALIAYNKAEEKMNKHLLAYDEVNHAIYDGDHQLTFSELHAMLMDNTDFVVLVYDDEAYHPMGVSDAKIVFASISLWRKYGSISTITMTSNGNVSLVDDLAERQENKVQEITEANKGHAYNFPSVPAVVAALDPLKTALTNKLSIDPASWTFNTEQQEQAQTALGILSVEGVAF